MCILKMTCKGFNKMLKSETALTTYKAYYNEA